MQNPRKQLGRNSPAEPDTDDVAEQHDWQGKGEQLEYLGGPQPGGGMSPTNQHRGGEKITLHGGAKFLYGPFPECALRKRSKTI